MSDLSIRALQPHEERVVAEEAALAENHRKLSVFIDSTSFHKVAREEAALLVAQRQAMAAYLGILRQRIEMFSRKVVARVD